MAERTRKKNDAVGAMTGFSGSRFTTHALNRAQERSIPEEILEIVIAYADIYHPAGKKGCKRILMSNIAFLEASANEVPQSLLSRARGLHVVLSDEGVVLTQYKRDPSRRRTRGHARRHNGGWMRL